jgi:protein involved in polysaccharide export with SLBB domain
MGYWLSLANPDGKFHVVVKGRLSIPFIGSMSAEGSGISVPRSDLNSWTVPPRSI